MTAAVFFDIVFPFRPSFPFVSWLRTGFAFRRESSIRCRPLAGEAKAGAAHDCGLKLYLNLYRRLKVPGRQAFF
jgi:hypothetical protein